MILDYNSTQDTYFLRLPRSEGSPDVYMREHGLDWSMSASTPLENVLYTSEPYAAASFAEFATSRAAERLSFITREVARSWAPSSDRHIDCPPDQELWPFQRASIDYALSRPHCLIGDQPGLGKTPIAICIANEMRAQRVLVVCPASIRLQWVDRIRQWSTMHVSYEPELISPITNTAIYQAVTTSRGGINPLASWVVVSWELVRSPGVWRALTQHEYDLLILDEAHYAKTVDAARSRAVFGGGRKPVAAPLIECASRTIALTGTPLPNRPREAFNLCRHLCWESIDFLSERAFNERFNPRKLNQVESRDGTTKVWVDEAVGRTGELQNRLRTHFMVRHLKRDVMTQLKMPIYDLVRVNETKAVKEALEAERLLDIPEDLFEGFENIEVLGHIAEARRLMGLAMAPQIADYARMCLDGGEEKIVIFAWHINVLDIFESKLASYGVLRVDGTDGPKAKYRKVQEFINDPEKRVILGNTLSLGTGTDGLQFVCNHALLAEPDWVHGNNEQCFDRLDRGGQSRTVQGDIFVAPGSIAEKVLGAALRKGHLVHKALDRRVA